MPTETQSLDEKLLAPKRWDAGGPPEGGEEGELSEEGGPLAREAEDAEEYLQEIAQTRPREEAFETLSAIAGGIEAQIKSVRFGGGKYLAVLFLSGLKDSIDVIGLGIVGTVLNIAIVPALYFIFFTMGGLAAKRMASKGFVAPAFVEFMPGLSLLPAYTLTTILIKLKADSNVRRLQAELEAVNREIDSL